MVLCDAKERAAYIYETGTLRVKCDVMQKGQLSESL